jgi:hypothetical protein
MNVIPPLYHILMAARPEAIRMRRIAPNPSCQAGRQALPKAAGLGLPRTILPALDIKLVQSRHRRRWNQRTWGQE